PRARQLWFAQVILVNFAIGNSIHLESACKNDDDNNRHQDMVESHVDSISKFAAWYQASRENLMNAAAVCRPFTESLEQSIRIDFSILQQVKGVLEKGRDVLAQ